MASVINTNVPSLFGQRNLSKSQGMLEQSLERLSSGLRINNAKDDAAGMSIAERMTSQIRGLDQAVRNSNDAISLTQTAEGGLNDIADSLQRLRELAVQSANATNTDLDRQAIQDEADQLISEVDRIASQTDFNGVKLLDGSFTEQHFQTGANANEMIAVDISSVRTSELGTTDGAALNSRQEYAATTAALSGNVLSEGDLILNGVTITSSQDAYDTASSHLKAESAIAKAHAINQHSDETGVTAVVNTNEHTGASMASAGTVAGSLSINGVTVAINTVDNNTSATRQAVVDAVNAVSGQTGVVAEDTGLDGGGVVLTAADGRNIVISSDGTMTSAASGIQLGATLGSFTLTSDKDIDISEAATGNIDNVGLNEGTFSGDKAAVATRASTIDGEDANGTAGGSISATAFSAGDFSINGVSVGPTRATDDTASSSNATQSAIAKAAAINRLSDQTGVVATADETRVDGASMTAAANTGTITINGVVTSSISTTVDAGASRKLVADAINAISDQTGVTAFDTGSDSNGVELRAADGRNVTIAFGAALDAASTGVADANTYMSSVTLESSSSFEIEASANGSTGVDNLGIRTGTFGSTKSGQALEELDFTTVEGATKAISALDNAIQTINSQRSNLGALQNRFDSTISNLQTQSDTLTASRSRIEDADFAKETAQMSKAQILQQAGVAMLAQANQLPQQVMQLLQG